MLNPDVQTGLTRAGFTSVTGVEDARVPARQELLAWSQPNPFTRSTTVRFRLPAAGPVRLGVYDLAGRLMSRLLDETRPAGEHAVVWQPGSVPSGVYYLRLESGGQIVTKRCVKVR